MGGEANHIAQGDLLHAHMDEKKINPEWLQVIKPQQLGLNAALSKAAICCCLGGDLWCSSAQEMCL